MSATSHFATPKEKEERFREYTLAELIPKNTTIFVDLINLTINLLEEVPGGRPRLIEQQRFTHSEFPVVLELFENFPYHSPLADLLSAFGGHSVEYYRKEILRANKQHNIDGLLRPLRNCISRFRQRLYPLGIDVRCFIETGYVLMPDEDRLLR